MSFRCGKCNKASKEREPMTRVVVETRPREYTNRHKRMVAEMHDAVFEETSTTQGYEIVREIGVCQACLADVHPLAVSG